MKRIQLNEFIEARYSEFSLFFMDTLRRKTCKFLKVYEEDVKLSGSVAADQFVYGDNLVIFLISGPEIRMTLKVHYSPSETSTLIPSNLKSATASQQDALYSVFAELGNLLAGSLKATLIEAGYVVGISLPIEASAYDEIISSDKLVRGRAHSYICCEIVNRAKFIVTLFVDNDEGPLKNYKYVKKGDQAQDEEFL